MDQHGMNIYGVPDIPDEPVAPVAPTNQAATTIQRHYRGWIGRKLTLLTRLKWLAGRIELLEGQFPELVAKMGAGFRAVQGVERIVVVGRVPPQPVEDDLPWSDDSDEEEIVVKPKPKSQSKNRRSKVALDQTPVELDNHWTKHPHTIQSGAHIARKLEVEFQQTHSHLEDDEMVEVAMEFCQSKNCAGFTFNKKTRKVYLHRDSDEKYRETHTPRCNWHEFYVYSQ